MSLIKKIVTVGQSNGITLPKTYAKHLRILEDLLEYKVEHRVKHLEEIVKAFNVKTPISSCFTCKTDKVIENDRKLAKQNHREPRNPSRETNNQRHKNLGRTHPRPSSQRLDHQSNTRKLPATQETRYHSRPQIRYPNYERREGLPTTLTRFLADENIPVKTVQTLKQKGMDIASILETSHGLRDIEVLNIANRQGRVIITFDTDFGNLVFKQKLETKGIILLRFKPKSPQQTAKAIEQLLATKTPIEKRFIVVREHDVRILPLT